MGYNDSYLGPTLRVHRGDDVEVAVTNALGQEQLRNGDGLLHVGPAIDLRTGMGRTSSAQSPPPGRGARTKVPP
jgi:FtsP/CotA-like multicopper oxidase with cupredoxin domain